MTNWIAANLVTWLFDISSFKNVTESTKTGYIYKTTYNGVATAKMGLDKIFPNSQVNGGILIAIVFAIGVYVLMSKTTFGYQLKACGSNRHAARYAGIADKRNIVHLHGHRWRTERGGRLALLPLRQHGVLLVHIPVAPRHRLQRYPRCNARLLQSHRHHLYGDLHVNARYLRLAADESDGLQRVHHERHHRRHRLPQRLLAGHQDVDRQAWQEE